MLSFELSKTMANFPNFPNFPNYVCLEFCTIVRIQWWEISKNIIIFNFHLTFGFISLIYKPLTRGETWDPFGHQNQKFYLLNSIKYWNRPCGNTIIFHKTKSILAKFSKTRNTKISNIENVFSLWPKIIIPALCLFLNSALWSQLTINCNFSLTVLTI